MVLIGSKIENMTIIEDIYSIEIEFTIAAPLLIRCLLDVYCRNTKIAYTTAEKLTFEAFY